MLAGLRVTRVRAQRLVGPQQLDAQRLPLLRHARPIALRTRQPDVLFLSSERTGIRGRRELREQPVIEAAPDLTVEVLSPGETRPDVLAKLEDYRAIGVRECWLVSPEAETVEVLRLGPAGWERDGLHGRGDQVRSVVLPELHLPVDHVFAEE